MKNYLLLISLIQLLSITGSAKTYVVENGGNDLGPGTVSEPLEHISEASDRAVAGDTIFIRKGRYEEYIQPLRSGFENEPIVYMAYPGEEHEAVIDGRNVTFTHLTDHEIGALVLINNLAFIEIHGLHFTKSLNHGASLKDATFINLSNNIFDKCWGAGIRVSSCSFIKIDSNNISNSGLHREYSFVSIWNIETIELKHNIIENDSARTTVSGLQVAGQITNFDCFNNTIKDLNGLGVEVYSLDTESYNYNISRNVICRTHGFAIGLDPEGSLISVIISSNLIYENNLSGVILSNGSTDISNGGKLSYVDLTFNTIVHNGKEAETFGWENAGGFVNLADSIDWLSLMGNIIAFNHTNQVVSPHVNIELNGYARYNLYYGMMESKEYNHTVPLIENPLFADEESENYYLQKFSPAVDAGVGLFGQYPTLNGVTQDLDGNQDGTNGKDYGAYEYIPLAEDDFLEGPSNICFSTPVSYTNSRPDVISYTWSVPADWVINSGQGTDSVSISAGEQDGYVIVTTATASGDSLEGIIMIYVDSPPEVAPIVGEQIVSPGSTQIYSTSSEESNEFNWTVPEGWSINEGQGLSNIEISVGENSGSVCVTSTNACGTSNEVCIYVEVSVLPGNTTISGQADVCSEEEVSYMASNDNAHTYTWTLPSDWTINYGQGSDSITVTPGNEEGSICVIAENDVGSGTETCFAVELENLPNTPAEIFGEINPMLSETYTYLIASIDNAEVYHWSVSGGNVEINENETSITWTSSGPQEIGVFTENACGSSQMKKLTVNVQEAVSINTRNVSSILHVFPNPATGIFYVEQPYNLSGNGIIKLTNITGVTVYEENVTEPMENTFIKIDATFIEKGMYILSYLVNEKYFITRMIIK